MNYQALFSRILQAVDTDAYLTPTSGADPAQRESLNQIAQMLQASDLHVDEARATVHASYEAGRLDRPHMLSALHVIAASPRVADYAEAARLAGEQEYAALDLGGPHLQANLASVDRHRGVLAFVQKHYAVALDHFTRALERQRSPENLGNVLASLLRLGELEEASTILAQVTRSLSPALVRDLRRRIDIDPDLAVLRTSEAP
jgi:tetratricopeptide (TPR) repeat protein